MKQTIALVDDDRNILTSVTMTLEQEGFLVAPTPTARARCTAWRRGRRIWRCWTSRCRGWTGWSCCSGCARARAMPVIFLTSKDEEVDQLMGLRLGRRRLHHQAVQPAPAAGAHPRPAAPQRGEQGGRLRRRARRGDRARRADAGRDQAPMHLEGPRHPADGDRVPAGEGAGDAAWHGEVARPADRRRLWREHLCRRPHHRQPRRARAQELPPRPTTSSTISRRCTASGIATRNSDIPAPAGDPARPRHLPPSPASGGGKVRGCGR